MQGIAKHSIGKLRPVARTKPKSPDFLGTLALQRVTLSELVEEMRDSGASELSCDLAGWFNVDPKGKYITVQISAPFARPARPTTIEEVLDDVDDDRS